MKTNCDFPKASFKCKSQQSKITVHSKGKETEHIFNDVYLDLIINRSENFQGPGEKHSAVCSVLHIYKTTHTNVILPRTVIDMYFKNRTFIVGNEKQHT